MENSQPDAVIFPVPNLVWVSIGSFLLFFLVGWIWSTIAGFRSQSGRGIRFILAFPLTNPLAVMFFVWKDWKTGLPGLLCHLVAFIALVGGGALAKAVEQARIEDHRAQIHQAGESLSVDSILPKKVPDESNVWTHPFLWPLALVGHQAGHGLRAHELDRYRRLEPPSVARSDISYPQGAWDPYQTGPYENPYARFHETTLILLEARDGVIDEGNRPQTWAACGEAVVGYYRGAGEELAGLREALGRPSQSYPHSWERHRGIPLPHLYWLKAFTASASLRVGAHSALGHSGEAFADLQMALRLVEAGDSDLLLCRLLQQAQMAMVLNAIRVAQQFHALEEQQWRIIDTRLKNFDFPGRVPESLRTERVLAALVIEPVIERNASEILRFLDRVGESTGVHDEIDVFAGVVRIPLNLLFGHHAQAILARDWRLMLEGYGERLDGVERALRRIQVEPWKDCRVPPLSREDYGHGYLMTMLPPSGDYDFTKALLLQSFIELARVGIALERHYVVQGHYPESIQELAPDFADGPLLDPVSGEPWHYIRHGEHGFTLYTVGMDGVDDGGEFVSPGRPGSALVPKDDLAWTVHPEPPPLPAFRQTNRKNADTGVEPP